MKKITSTSNPFIKHIIELHRSKGRLTHGQYIAEGWRICKTLITAKMDLVWLCVIEDEIQTAYTLKVPESKIICVTRSVMNKISTASTPSGMLAIFAIPTKPTQITLNTPGVVLADITDPGNMGTLLRTSAALGIKTIITIAGTDCWGPKVIQASAGTIGMLNLYKITWHELVILSQKNNIPLCGLVVKNGKNPQEINLKNQLLVIGNEAHGIVPEWLEDCNTTITLKMPGNTESLNAAVAGSIALYLATTE